MAFETVHDTLLQLYPSGSYVVSVHYEFLTEEYGKISAMILYGEVQCGKSEATRAILSTTGTVGGNFFTTISDACAFAYTSQIILGIVIDDPSDLKISKKLLYHFNKAKLMLPPRTIVISEERPPLHHERANKHELPSLYLQPLDLHLL
jgi:hypothetical protein